MKNLNKRAQYYTGLLRAGGANVEAEEVYGTLALAACKAQRLYSGQKDHTASLDTYTERAFEKAMTKMYNETIHRQRHEIHCEPPEISTSCDAEMRLLLREIFEGLGDHELVLAVEMARPSEKVSQTMAAYQARRPTRHREIGKTADAVARVYGLNERTVRDDMRRIKEQIVNTLS